MIEINVENLQNAIILALDNHISENLVDSDIKNDSPEVQENILSGIGPSIKILNVREDLKASEKYIDLIIIQEDGYKWEGSIPYFYRRTGLFIEDIEELAKYLIRIIPYFTEESINNFVIKETKYWEQNFIKSDVTIMFFKELVKMKWTSDFPPNDNPQRRIQDIKEKGYTIASRRNGRKAERLLLPLPRSTETGYETFSSTLRKKALKILQNINVYEVSSANKHGLLPDHKFPEIRWDKNTIEENPDSMTEDEVRQKFQLIDNQRNQQKREICRKCFQTGKRGVLFGIKYFYSGNENWDNTIPKTGKVAENGCIGCGWYDIEAWRDHLNKTLES